MALITRRIASFADGAVTVDVVYDDATMRVEKIVCANATKQALYFEMTSTSDRSRKSYAPDGERSTELTLTTQEKSRYPLSYHRDKPDQIDGLDGILIYPYEAK